jgi:hypothetical protein
MTHSAAALRTLAVAVVVPLIVTVVGVILMFTWVGDVPDPTANHWGFDGAPNGFGSPLALPISVAAVSLPFIALFGGAITIAVHRHPPTVVTKLLAVTSLWVPVLLTVALGGTLAGQRGIATAADAPSPGLALLAGVLTATILAVVAWYVLPRAVKFSRGASSTVAPLVLDDAERVSWIHTASSPAGFAWLWAGLGLVVAAVVIGGIVASGGAAWALSIVPVVLLVAVLASVTWHLRVDAGGFVARSALGWPRIVIPIADIERADVIAVNPVAEYGGWGIRFGVGHRLGIILRSGEALEVVRHNGRALVVTVDDATTAAALITALQRRPSATRG